MALFGVAVTAYPFIASLSPSEKAESNSLAVIDKPPLEPGAVYAVIVNGFKLFLLKPTQQQQDSIKALDSHVWDPASLTYKPKLGIYVYWGHSPKWGCPLQHRPPHHSGLIEWGKDAQWLGGYWDSWCEVSYDYSGRAIKTYRYTYNGYTWSKINLKSPTIFYENNDKFLVSIIQR